MTDRNTPIYPDPGSAIPDMPGYLVADCRHRIAQSEWKAGCRTCERCPDVPHTVPYRDGLTGRTFTIERTTIDRMPMKDVGVLCLADRIDGKLQGIMPAGWDDTIASLTPYYQKEAERVGATFVEWKP